MILESPFRNGQELEPAGLRALVAALLDIADEAKRQDTNAHPFLDAKGVTEITWVTTAWSVPPTTRPARAWP